MRPSLLFLPLAATLLASCVSTTGQTAFDDGVRLYREGYYASARDAFDSAVRDDPRNATYWNNRAVAKVRLGDLDGAVQDYTQAMALAPQDAEIVFNRGNAYAAAGNLPAAINDFTTAVTIRPGYSQAYFNRGSVRSSMGDVSGAVADWQFAVETERDPWTRAAMRKGSGLDYAYASPALPGGVVANPSGPTVAVAPPAAAPVTPPPPPNPDALTAQALDVRALVARAMTREVEGDRAGALADLRAAVAAEPDATRRARIDRLLRVLEASR
jgi:tetratricopeptide (TPR) repeat protein